MAPDRTVRTVQQMAVLCVISEKGFADDAGPHVQDAQSHQKAQANFSPEPNLEIAQEEDRECRENEVGNDRQD